jgi:hypothetical protein
MEVTDFLAFESCAAEEKRNSQKNGVKKMTSDSVNPKVIFQSNLTNSSFVNPASRISTRKVPLANSR